MERVSFKSIPEMYEKEKSGIKNNTVRCAYDFQKDHDDRFIILDEAIKKEKNLIIEITNVKNGEKFERVTTDITKFKNNKIDVYIITWKNMNIQKDVKELMFLFRQSFINYNFELILIPKINLYFNLKDINTKRDLDKKMIHWVSKDCFDNNNYWNKYITERFNKYFKREFTEKELKLIYARLGNEVNRELTEKFLDSGLNLEVLRED